MINKTFKLLKPMALCIGALSIITIINVLPINELYNPIVLTLVFLHTMPILTGEYEDILKDRFKLICYIYSLTAFVLTKSVLCLLILNIWQSCSGLYEYTESEANI